MLLLALAAAAAIRAAPCTDATFEDSRFTACRYDARTNQLRLALTDGNGTPLRDFAALSASLGGDKSKVLFAMNAGMFDAAGRPVGLYVENGTERHAINRASGDGNFHMQPNGVFSLGAKGMRLDATASYDTGTKPLWATQSGPMLLMGGKLTPNISDDGPSHYIRNAVCVLGPKDAVFVISDDAVSFGRLARFMRGTLGCREALYLDGAVSGAWIPSAKRMDNRAPLGPMIVVLKKD
jgi:uncharacterized protein YigE (DUF2233 family)